MNYVNKIIAPIALSICTLLACGAANAATLNVHNDTDMPMDFLHISPASSGYWGVDLLGDRYIGPGESAQVEFSGGDSCYFDLRAVFRDDTQFTPLDRYGVNLCEITDWHISE